MYGTYAYDLWLLPPEPKPSFGELPHDLDQQIESAACFRLVNAWDGDVNETVHFVLSKREEIVDKLYDRHPECSQDAISDRVYELVDEAWLREAMSEMELQ